MQRIKKELLVDKNILSATIRKKVGVGGGRGGVEGGGADGAVAPLSLVRSLDLFSAELFLSGEVLAGPWGGEIPGGGSGGD